MSELEGYHQYLILSKALPVHVESYLDDLDRQAFVPDTLEDNKKWIKNIYLQTFKMHNSIPDPDAEAMFRGVMSALLIKEGMQQ